jgi:bifunctional non-homologous end joining protein LigD
MQPTLARPPFHRDGWIYEEKVDGWRMLAYKDADRVRLISRNAVIHTHRFPDIAAAMLKLRSDTLVLEGEIAVFDEHLVSRFQLLGEPDPAVLCTPPIFIAFDVLQVGRQDLRRLRLDRCRRVLEDAVDGSQLVLPVRRLESHGARAWATVERRGLEGFVAKDPASVYRPGATRSWIKVKLRHERVFVVGGIRNVDAFDGVLVGEKVGDELRYRGVVEWGFKARDVLRLMRDARIFAQSTPPFSDLRTMRNAVWIEPRLLAEVSYSEIVDGRLRAPSWRGLMRDESGLALR